MSRLALAALGLAVAHAAAVTLLASAVADAPLAAPSAGSEDPAPPTPATSAAPAPAASTARNEPEAAADPFERYLRADQPVADGFDFPLGDADGTGEYTDPATGRTHQGFYVATRFGERIKLGLHPGEDWNVRGGGNTDEGQPVHAVAAGRVVYVYPKPFDADWGVSNKLITATQREQIAAAWAVRKHTPGNTKLGGGIGFHGWIEEWDDDGPRHLSWGCVVMHLGDIARVYPQLQPGTMVVIL